jgi:shikimate kinase
MIIFLIGFMGAGKSSLGKRLANKLELPFIDSDKAIEEIEQLTISEIFEKKGESYFRTREKEWLQSLNEKDVVIALGGGTPCQDGNIELINGLGTSIYIQMNVDLLANRLVSAKGKRPLIEKYKGKPDELKEFIRETLAEREVFYKQANIQFAGDNINSEKLQGLVDLINLPPLL